MKFRILRPCRTEKAKAIRRKYGDRGGYCKFKDKMFLPAEDGNSNTITSIQKDNLLHCEYDI